MNFFCSYSQDCKPQYVVLPVAENTPLFNNFILTYFQYQPCLVPED